MAVEQWTDEMLNQLGAFIQETAAMTRANAQVMAENSRAIAANTQGTEDLKLLVAENSRAITDLRVLVTDLREGQAMLAQMVIEEREARQEFRRTTNAALDRIDRTLEELRRGREGT